VSRDLFMIAIQGKLTTEQEELMRQLGIDSKGASKWKLAMSARLAIYEPHEIERYEHIVERR
jgi:hypothetical protein